MSDQNEVQVFTQEDVEANKIMGVLSYLGILVLIPLLVDSAKQSPFARFHANQGLVLLIAGIILGVIANVPIIGWIIAPIASIVLLVFAIMGIIAALNGQGKKLPLIGNYTLIK